MLGLFPFQGLGTYYESMIIVGVSCFQKYFLKTIFNLIIFINKIMSKNSYTKINFSGFSLWGINVFHVYVIFFS